MLRCRRLNLSRKNYLHYLRCGMLTDAIRIEASSICQLNCHLCRMLDTKNTIIGQGYLPLRGFKKIIDDNRWIKKVELSNWGEIFLNPELKGIIKYAYSKKVGLFAANGVNLNTIDSQTIEYLVKYRLPKKIFYQNTFLQHVQHLRNKHNNRAQP